MTILTRCHYHVDYKRVVWLFTMNHLLWWKLSL